MVPRTSAEVVFRTGFYKITIPLARCKACTDKEKSKHTMFPELGHFNEAEAGMMVMI